MEWAELAVLLRSGVLPAQQDLTVPVAPAWPAVLCLVCGGGLAVAT